MRGARLEGFNARPRANLSESVTAAQLTGGETVKSHGAINAVGSLTMFYSGKFVTFDCHCCNESLKLSVIFHRGP